MVTMVTVSVMLDINFGKFNINIFVGLLVVFGFVDKYSHMVLT